MSLRTRAEPLAPQAIIDRVAELAPEASRLVLALSGGIDSILLLHLLAAGAAGATSAQLHVAHVDHGLHPDSPKWAAHCKSQCDALGIPLSIINVSVDHASGKGLEAAARQARYAALAALVDEDCALITAHHLDDQAETVLLHLLRGAGTRGLAGMLPASPFGSGRLVRPLLEYTRAQIEDHANRLGLVWIEDPSNQDTHLRRNLLRLELLPRMAEVWPGAAHNIARTATLVARERAVLDELAEDDLAALECPHRAEGLAIKLEAAQALDGARLANLLRHMARVQGLAMPLSAHMDQMLHEIMHPSSSGYAQVRWQGGALYRERDLVRIAAAQEVDIDASPSKFDLPWLPTTPLAIPELGLELVASRKSGAGLSCDRIDRAGSLRVTTRRGGERCQPDGYSHHKSLKKLLQEACVAPDVRARLPLVFVDGVLAAIGDRWYCRPFAAAPDEEGYVLTLVPMTEQ